ncbi:NACHT domain-containing protein [Salmonella enterica]|nr:NACHT domain-containing protein [Salmonella enterica subsp. enterica serovar Infantis]EEW5493292.1 NACHT domain-containing protein [Salmonella enterica]EHQ2747218.1 NACHT domain-containing protein [Salmonella enterica]
MQPVSLDVLVSASLPWAKEVIKNKILPIIESSVRNYLIDVHAARFLNKNLERFLSNVKGQCSLVNTLAFQNTPVELLDIYEPMSIYYDNEKKPYTCLIKDNADLLDNFNHILITDSAGMGKSTLMKRIALDCIANKEYIPIYIELRRAKDYDFALQVKHQLGLGEDISDNCLKKIPFIYLFDGIDEIPQQLKSKIVNLLSTFANNFSESKIIITSRHDNFLSELHGFSRFKINPLETNQAYDLLRRYDGRGPISSQLIKGLRLENGHNLNEFLSTPLYVSLLFCAYKFKPIIPRKRELFYSQVFDALYESHDLTKELGYVREKFSKLDSTDFHQVLRRLGFWCLKDGGKIEFTKDELQITLQNIISKIPGISTSPSLFIQDLIETVPLFVKEGAIIRWSHKSLMEYFAAMFICRDTKERQKEILTKLYYSPESIRHRNLFSLCADIDYSSFRSSIIKCLLLDLKSSYEELKNETAQFNCDTIKTKAEISLAGNSIIYLFDKDKENELLNDFFKGDLRAFNELSENGSHIITTITGVANHWLVIARESTIKSDILSILKSRKPSYFHKTHRFFNTDPELESNIMMEVGKQPEVKFNLTLDSLKDINKDKEIRLIESLLSFENTPQIKYDSALFELEQINCDESNGINQLLDGF